MNINELYEIGFKDEITNKPNGILTYHLIDDEDDETFLQICLKNTDHYPVLITNQFDWNEMKGNITHLSLINVLDTETLKAEIVTLKRLFCIAGI